MMLSTWLKFGHISCLCVRQSQYRRAPGNPPAKLVIQPCIRVAQDGSSKEAFAVLVGIFVPIATELASNILVPLMQQAASIIFS
jgi:hypothetical protein